MIEEGDPQWSPDDRDLVTVYLAEQTQRHSCGHYPWQAEDVEGLEPGYRVCAMCAVMEPYKTRIREQNRARQEDEHGLTFAWFAPREENDGN